MATKFSPCKGSYVLNQFPSNVMFGMNGFHLSASGAIQGHHGPLVKFSRLSLSGDCVVKGCTKSFARDNVVFNFINRRETQCGWRTHPSSGGMERTTENPGR